MNGMPIQVVNSIKILSQIISDDGLDFEHIEKRMRATNGMTAKLNCMNLTSLHIHPKTKAKLFRTYIRPILTYGTENMALDRQEINQIKRMEGNCLKRMLKIPTRCRTTDLFDSLRIEQSADYLLRMKLKFLLRLDSNDLIRPICESLADLKFENSFTTEIASHLELTDYTYESLLVSAAVMVKKMDQSKKSYSKTYNSKVIQLKKVMNTKNRFVKI